MAVGARETMDGGRIVHTLNVDQMAVTNFSCNLSDADFTCRDGCGSQGAGPHLLPDVY